MAITLLSYPDLRDCSSLRVCASSLLLPFIFSLSVSILHEASEHIPLLTAVSFQARQAQELYTL